MSFLSNLGYPVKAAYSYGSINLTSSYSSSLQSLSLYVMAIVLLYLAYFLVTRFSNLGVVHYQKKKPLITEETFAQKEPRLFLSSVTVMLMALVLTSKVFSPQYILWFVMFIPLSFYRQEKLNHIMCVMALAYSLLSSIIYPYAYRAYIINNGLGPNGLGLTMLMFRSGLLLLSFFILMREFIGVTNKVSQQKTRTS